LEEHFPRCKFYYYEQRCYLSTDHSWKDDIHLIRFLDSSQNVDILRTLYNQEKHVPTWQYKFKCERIVATLKEYITSPAFVLWVDFLLSRLLHKAAGLLHLQLRHVLLAQAMELVLLVIDLAVPMVMEVVAMAVLNAQVTLGAHLAIAMFELSKSLLILCCWTMTCLWSLLMI